MDGLVGGEGACGGYSPGVVVFVGEAEGAVEFVHEDAWFVEVDFDAEVLYFAEVEEFVVSSCDDGVVFVGDESSGAAGGVVPVSECSCEFGVFVVGESVWGRGGFVDVFVVDFVLEGFGVEFFCEVGGAVFDGAVVEGGDECGEVGVFVHGVYYNGCFIFVKVWLTRFQHLTKIL